VKKSAFIRAEKEPYCANLKASVRTSSRGLHPRCSTDWRCRVS